MKIGAWIHSYDDLPLAEQVPLAAEQGLRTVRSYHIGYAERIGPILSGLTGTTLLGGMSVSAEELVRDWRTAPSDSDTAADTVVEESHPLRPDEFSPDISGDPDGPSSDARADHR